ncbi:MAG TPA: hypothetical protein VHF88_10430 [Thermoleophilaceae bacterium]|nr:hypothetical protein [Thermoleophilaceae bacterium]
MSAAGGAPSPPGQTVVASSARGRVVAVDSAYHVAEANRAADVIVAASYCGVLPARFVAERAPRAAIGVDCAIGKDGAGIAGLWYLEALGIPAAAAAVMSVHLGDGVDVWRSGRLSRVNAPAESVGVTAGMAVAEACELLLERDPVARPADEISHRTVVETAPDGAQVVCTDSIAFGLPEDRDRNVLCTAGHTGRSAVPYLLDVRPRGFVCSDGGRGRDDAGIAGLAIVEREGLAGAAVDALTARMGDGLSTYRDGVVSACNAPARERGVAIGQTAREAAGRLLALQP